MIRRVLFVIACRVVGGVRRRPFRWVAAWFAASLLPMVLADAVQLGLPVLVGLAFLVAGGRRHLRSVEAVSRYWATARGEEYRPGWLGRSARAAHARGAL